MFPVPFAIANGGLEPSVHTSSPETISGSTIRLLRSVPKRRAIASQPPEAARTGQLAARSALSRLPCFVFTTSHGQFPPAYCRQRI